MIVFLNKKKLIESMEIILCCPKFRMVASKTIGLSNFFSSIQKWNAVIDRFRENNSSVYLNCLSGVSGLFVF